MDCTRTFPREIACELSNVRTRFRGNAPGSILRISRARPRALCRSSIYFDHSSSIDGLRVGKRCGARERAQPLWDGEPVNYSCVIGDLVRLDGLHEDVPSRNCVRALKRAHAFPRKRAGSILRILSRARPRALCHPQRGRSVLVGGTWCFARWRPTRARGGTSPRKRVRPRGRPIVRVSTSAIGDVVPNSCDADKREVAR